MSLLAQIQTLTERTYLQSTGVNFEHFVIGYSRFRDLSRLAPRSNLLSEMARVFFKTAGHRLYIAIYFNRDLIEHLEANDPRYGLSEKNITAFAIFIEEINHAVHCALHFLEGETDVGREPFLRNLEIQAKVDTYLFLKYFLAHFNPSKQLEQMDRLWLRYHVFENLDFDYVDAVVAGRYLEAVAVGEKFTRFLEVLPVQERRGELHRFRHMSYAAKKQYVRFLP